MKKLLYILTALLTFSPLVASANIPVAWNATSTAKGFIQPNAVNGNNPLLNIPATGTSTFAGSLNITGGILAGYIQAPIFSSGTCTGVGFTVDSPTFAVDCTNHRVGIGTISPSAPLQISSSGNTINTAFLSNLADNQNVWTSWGQDLGSNINHIEFGYHRVGNGNNNNYAFLEFGGQSPSWVVTALGNVGIGTTSPYGNLAVQGNADGSGKPILTLDGSSGDPSNYWLGIVPASTRANAIDYNFVGMSAADPRKSLMTLQTNGNIGISTTTPVNLLSVAGTIGVGTLGANSSTISDSNGSLTVSSGGTNRNININPSGTSGNLVSTIGISGNAQFIIGTTALTIDDNTPQGGNRIFSNGDLEFVSSGAKNMLMIPSVGGSFGIGTTSPYAYLSVQSSASTGDAFVVATSSAASVWGIDNDGHQFTSGPNPAISTCGTGTGTVVGDDISGVITTATAATACTMTFSKIYRGTPTCIVTDNSLVGFADISSISTSAVTFGISSALTGGKLYYSCEYSK